MSELVSWINRCRLRHRFFYVLQAVISVMIFCEILCFGLGRNALQGIISESTAMMHGWNDSTFLTDHLFLIYFSCKCTVCTVTINFFPEQHQCPPPRTSLYTILRLFSIGFFYKPKPEQCNWYDYMDTRCRYICF